MRFILFGNAHHPVLNVLEQVRLYPISPGQYRVLAEPQQLSLAAQWGLITLAEETPPAGRFTERVMIIEAEVAQNLECAVQATLPAYTRVVANACPAIQQVYLQTHAAQRQGILWDQVLHTLIVGWLMDLGVPLFLRQHGYAERIDGWQVLGYTMYPNDARDCGVRLHCRSDIVVGELWILGCQRWPHLPFNLMAQEIDALVQIAEQPAAPLTPPITTMLRKLCYLGVLRYLGGAYEPALPVFFEADCAVLLKPILAASAEIAAMLCQRLDQLPAGEQQGGRLLRLAFLRLVLTKALGALLQADILPTVPACAPRSWGLWLTVRVDSLGMFHPFGPTVR